MSKDTNNKKTSSQTAPQEDKFSYINNLVNNSNKILNNKAISEESKKYSSLFENSLIANQLGKTQELLPGDVKNITGGADYEKVQDILGQGYNIFDGSLNVRKALGDKQSGWAQAGGALNQAIVGEFIGGTIEGTGRLLDIKGSIDLYNGNIKEFDNVLTELGSGLKGWAEHSTPIFGSEEMLTSGWLAKGLVTTASSLSLLIPAMGTVKAIGGLGRALGVLKSMETLSTAGRTAAWLRTGISQAVVSRHMENWLEAREVWDNTLNEYVNNKGLSLEEAEQAASKAVRQSYIFNTAMLVFDIPQYVLIGRKTFGSSEASDKIMAALGKSKSSILGSRAKSLGINMASEGFEEAYQYVVGNEVVNYQMYKDGLASNPVSDKFLSGYMKDNEFWTSVIFGALGAGVHSGVGKMFNKAFYSKKLETNDNLRIENFKKTQEIQKRIYNKLAKAYESNNQEAVESAIEELTYLSALNSYEFGNSDIALETMGMIKNSSNEELIAMGLPEDKIEEFKANIDNAINQTKDIFKKLKKNSKIFGDEVNKEVTTVELQLEKIDRLINNSEKSITEKRKELEKSQDLKNLSTEEQQILENKLFIDGGKSRISAIDEALQKNNQLTEEQRINFETQKAEIEQLVKEKSKANKELITGLTGSSYLGNVFSDKGLSSISTLFDEEFNSISASVNDNNVSSREEYLSSLDKSKREKLESLEKRLDKISKANKLYTSELQKELAKHGIFKLRQKDLQKNLDYYTSEKYLKEKKQVIDEIRKKQAEAAQQAINDEKVADDTINSKANQNKKTNEAETTTVPGFNEIAENLNNKVKQKTEEQGYDAEKVDFVNNYFNASKNNNVNKQIKKLLDKNKIYNFFSTLNEDYELSDLESAIYDYYSNPTEVNFNKIKTLAKEDNSYNKESDVFKAEEAIKEIENQAEEEVKAEVIAAKKVVALNQSNEIPETTDNSVETNVLDENEDVFESDIREYKEYDEESSGAVSVEPTSLAWRSSSAMDNLEEDNDVELTKFLENPSIDITEFNAEFEIDEDYLKQNKTLYDKLNSGETLTQEDINNIPIKVYFLNKEGNRVKNRNNEDLFSYLHANDFWNGKNIQSVNPEDLKKELSIFKFNILKKLNNNEKAISKILNQKDGILQEDYEMVLNPATNVKERKLIFKPLSEAIALDENEIEFLFGDSFNQYILGNTIDQESLQHTTATPGALYIKFKKPNGKVFPARVFVRRLDNNDVNALFSILNYAYVQNQTLKTEISKLSTELQKELKSSQFVKDLIDVLGSKATLLDVLNNFVYEGKLSQGKGLNELRKVGNDVFINGKKYNVVDFTTDKQNEIKAELAKKMINISAKKLNQSSYKKILIDDNVVQTHIRLKKGYVTPFSTPTTVISNRLEGDSTNQSSDVEERFDDETTTQSTQESAELNKPTQSSNKVDEIKADIERLEKEKQDLLNKPSQESEVKEVTPSKVDTYLSVPNQDGSFNSSSSRMSFIPGASIMAFESIGNNKFAVYISKNDAAVKLSLQYPDRTIDPVFEGASYFNPKAKEIQVIKPAIVELQGDKYVLVEKGLIDYDNVGINKSKETKTKPDTSNIDAQIAQKQAELAELEKRKPEIVNRYSDSDVKSNPDKIYVFGDNVQRTGTGGQAQIRNNSNAFGIATKLKPSNNQDAFMSDNDLESNKKIIDSDIQKILNQNKPLVFPKDGFGTGLAKLKEKAPKTYEYLRQRLLEEFYFDNENGKIIENNKKLAELESKQEVVEETKLSTNVKEGVTELFESNPELANAVYEALGFNQMITPNDRIVFGHPTIGKSFLKNQGEDKFISLDDDYATEINSKVKEIADKYSVTTYQVKDGGTQNWNNEYNQMMQEMFNVAKQKAISENKTLFTSNTNLLKNNAESFDKVINLTDKEFERRIQERGAKYDIKRWKSQINDTISKLPTNKVINTDKYLSDLFIIPQQKQQAQQVYSQYIEQTGKQDIEGFKEFIQNNKKNEIVEDENVVDKNNESEKNILRRFKDEDTDDFDPESILSTKQTPQKTDSDKLNEAVEVLNKILPKEVAITLQDDLIKIFENGDAAVASFSKAGIILSSFADDTDAYHEAFHAVFRLLLSGKERNSLIENSKNDFLEPTDEQIKILMDRHNLSKEEATDLYYEEILADEFGKYMSNPNEYTFNNKEQKSFFEKLLSWINNILGIKSNREKVFSSIRKGDYNNSKQAKDSLANLDVNSTELAMFNNEVNYMLKSVEILQSDKAKQVFAKAEKNNWDLNKTLTELQIPKEQKQLILDLGINNREQIVLELASNYSYTVEVNTAKFRTKSELDFEAIEWDELGFPTKYKNKITGEVKNEVEENSFLPTQYYSDLTVPGGTNYIENEISTPLITPSIKGHAEFSTDNGIGWFRSDDKVKEGTQPILSKEEALQRAIEDDNFLPFDTDNTGGIPTKTRRILEVQSDLFQKGRGEDNLLQIIESRPNVTDIETLKKIKKEEIKADEETPFGIGNEIVIDGVTYERNASNGKWRYKNFQKIRSDETQNQFLQLLNKDNNWVTFFVKSIIQDSAKKGYEKVLFPSGNTASKVERHTTLEEFKREKEDRIKVLEKQKENHLVVGKKKIGQQFEVNTPEGIDDIFDTYTQENFDNQLKAYNTEINQLKQELERVDKEGFGALRPIYKFYSIDLRNTLVKQYGEWVNTEILKTKYGKEWKEKDLTWQELQDHVKSDTLKFITDEYGNTWNEVTIKQSRDLSPIVFKTKNRIVESKSEQLSYSNYFEARMNKPGNPLSEQQFNSLSLTEQEVLINQTKYC